MIFCVSCVARCTAVMLAAVTLTACSERVTETPATAVADAAMTGVIPDSQGVVVTDAQSRPTPPLATVGVAYLSITNHGTTPDRLLSANTPVAARIELHANSTEGDMARMRPVEALELSPHQTAIMDPGGMHFMLTDLAAPLIVGEHFPLTLMFESAGEITVDVLVQDGTRPSHGAH
jgi:periplasmic copper chaperone A